MAVRKIVIIDEELCDGCGACIPYCAEGALQIIDGKAKLVRDDFCDGLGNCLGECPQGAIEIEEREADEFDEAAVHQHLVKLEEEKAVAVPASAHAGQTAECGCSSARPATFDVGFQPQGGGCPSARPMEMIPSATAAGDSVVPKQASALSHWPVKLKLVPPHAPFLKEADLVLLADCVPLTYPNLHADILEGNAVVIGCPKFDDPQEDLQRLTAILRDGGVRSLKVVHAEVPCCFGYRQLAQNAVAASGRQIPLEQMVVGLRGEIKQAG